jgi:hypothetical protein
MNENSMKTGVRSVLVEYHGTDTENERSAWLWAGCFESAAPLLCKSESSGVPCCSVGRWNDEQLHRFLQRRQDVVAS